LNNKKFSIQANILESEPMTINGTVNKIFMLFVCLLAGAGISLYFLFTGNTGFSSTLMILGACIAFVLVIVTSFKINLAKYLAAPYALCEGFAIGGISAMFESAYQGIVIQAILATFGVLFVMLMLYKAKAIQYTDKFASVLKTGLLSILAVYLVQFVVSFFGRGIPGIFESGPIGILFSLVVIGFASMALIQDFFFIEEASQRMLPKDYEWYGAMGLMITLVWLYTEILRLLAKLNSRR
jgi:uncharacterized YccA/Bax inhibitor family protein